MSSTAGYPCHLEGHWQLTTVGWQKPEEPFEPLCQVRSADCLQHISRGISTYATVLLWSVLHQRLLAIQTTVLLVG